MKIKEFLKKASFDIEKLLRYIFLFAVMLLCFFVFVVTYIQYDHFMGQNFRPTGYELAKTVVIDSWKNQRNFHLLLLLPVSLLVIFNTTLKIKDKRLLNAAKGCLFWITIVLFILFSFALGALMFDIAIMTF